jgi:hypothetical protein
MKFHQNRYLRCTRKREVLPRRCESIVILRLRRFLSFQGTKAFPGKIENDFAQDDAPLKERGHGGCRGLLVASAKGKFGGLSTSRCALRSR